LIGDIRGFGLLQAIELVKNPSTKEPINAGKLFGLISGPIASRGLWLVNCGRYGNVLRFMPPLTIAHDHFKNAIEIIVDVLNEHKDDLCE